MRKLSVAVWRINKRPAPTSISVISHQHSVCFDIVMMYAAGLSWQLQLRMQALTLATSTLKHRWQLQASAESVMNH